MSMPTQQSRRISGLPYIFSLEKNKQTENSKEHRAQNGKSILTLVKKIKYKQKF